MNSVSIFPLLLTVIAVSCGNNCSEPIAKPSNTAKAVEQDRPISTPNTLGFGPIIGESLLVSVPTPGKYRGSSDFSQFKFITRERTESSRIESRTVIELLADGKMTACFAGKKDAETSVSRYESRDGEDHKYDQGSLWLLGARGSWSTIDGKAKLLLTEVRQGTCTPDVPQTGFELPFELTCVLFVPGEKLPGSTMACRLDKEPGWLNPAGLDLGKSSSAGPWSLRFTERGPAPGEEENGPWLLLGPSEGLHVKSTDEGRDPAPTVTFAEGALELNEDDWKYKRTQPDNP